VRDWCNDDESNIQLLRDRSVELTRVGNADATVASVVCEEFVQRHVRIGNSPSICEAATRTSQAQSFTDSTGATSIASAARKACSTDGRVKDIRQIWAAVGDISLTVPCVRNDGVADAEGFVSVSSTGVFQQSGCLQATKQHMWDANVGYINVSGQVVYSFGGTVRAAISQQSNGVITVTANPADPTQHIFVSMPPTKINKSPQMDHSARAIEVLSAFDGVICNRETTIGNFEPRPFEFTGSNLRLQTSQGDLSIPVDKLAWGFNRQGWDTLGRILSVQFTDPDNAAFLFAVSFSYGGTGAPANPIGWSFSYSDQTTTAGPAQVRCSQSQL
jgi:hypothetical protein